MDWFGRIPTRMTARTSARRCSNRVSADSSTLRSSSGWTGSKPNGWNCKKTILSKFPVRALRSSGFSPTSRRDLLLLPAETEKVWNFLKDQPALQGFVLAGGSALALSIRHRISEDLDFVYPDIRLPRQRLEALLRHADEKGFHFQRNDNEAAVEEFVLGGMELHDYQQDFLVNDRVKVSFFAPDHSLQKILSGSPQRKPRVASLAELFKSKCLVSAVRSKTRDWLDLFLLMREHGFTIRDYQAAFREAGIPDQSDIGLARLCSGTPQRDDEGYAHLLQNPPALEEMRAFFVAQRDKLEIESAAEAMRQKHARPPEHGK